MGLCLNQTPEMGEYAVEVRRESFYLTGPMFLYPSEHGFGTVEIVTADIGKIRACLDAIEETARITVEKCVINMRTTPERKARLQQAAADEGKTLTDFILGASLATAREVLASPRLVSDEQASAK